MKDQRHIFYVYEHWRPDTAACFYVGKGKGPRAWDMKHDRHIDHTSVVSQLTSRGLIVDVRIVAKDLENETAYKLEEDRIAFYGLANLVNKRRGARAPPVLSAESRRKIGDRSRGNKYCLGKKHKPETRARLRDLGIASIETFKKYSALGPKAMARRVVCLDDDLVYESASAAARHYGVSKSALIELCLGKNYRLTVGGLRFKYLEDEAA